MKKAIKVTPKKWWSIKAWKSARTLQEFDNWLVEHPSEIIKFLMSIDWSKYHFHLRGGGE